MSAETRTVSSTGGAKGAKVERFDLIPIGPLTELAAHFGRGARKYDDHQWRKGYEWSKSYAALMRHLTAFWAGFDLDVCSNDPEGCSSTTADGEPFEASEPDTCYNHTGSHHMAAVAWHAFVLLEFKDVHPEHDDRHRPPVPSGWSDLGRVDETHCWMSEPMDRATLVNYLLRRSAETYSFPHFFVAGTGEVVDNSRDFLGYGPDMLRKHPRPVKDTPQA